VVAQQGNGALSLPATRTWTINLDFGIRGDISQPLYPGRTVPLDLVFTNPYSSAQGLDIVTVTVTVEHGTVPGCDGPANVIVTPSAPSFSPPWPVNIPRNATRSLSDLGIPSERWPQVTMRNLSTNQDACKSASFRFSYTGTASKK
jgi:hypothetical protein